MKVFIVIFQIKPCDLVIYLEASDEVMKDRLLNRGKTSGRADDNEETIQKRLKTFHDNNDPIVKNYSKKMVKVIYSNFYILSLIKLLIRYYVRINKLIDTQNSAACLFYEITLDKL